MKTLRSFTIAEAEDLPNIHCDMDGVLCNFMKGADEAVGGDFVSADKDERWNKINQTKGFWANLEWMPGGKRLYVFISRYNPYILSAYSGRDPNSKNGKMTWLGRHTGVSKRNINLVKRADKKLYAKTDGKPNILIDDYMKNIREWENKGGIGIRHTDVAKTIGELKRLGFK
jgi:hypothetical protein